MKVAQWYCRDWGKLVVVVHNYIVYIYTIRKTFQTNNRCIHYHWQVQHWKYAFVASYTHETTKSFPGIDWLFFQNFVCSFSLSLMSQWRKDCEGLQASKQAKYFVLFYNSFNRFSSIFLLFYNKSKQQNKKIKREWKKI